MATPTLLIPLLAALGYAICALCFKRAIQDGVGLWRICFVSNVVLGLGYSIFWNGQLPQGSQWLAPLVAGGLFFLGQLLNFLAIERGDVSVATPLLGIKVFLVAVFTVLVLGDNVAIGLWVASGLLFFAIWMLRGKSPAARLRSQSAIVFAILGSTAFALADVTVQKYAPATGTPIFLPIMFWTNAVLSLPLISRFRGSLLAFSPSTGVWLMAGSILFATSAIGVTWTIATYGQAVAVNVAYATRGFFSVLVVWSIGHLAKNSEGSLGTPEMLRRLASAVLIIIALVLAAFSL